MLSQMKTIKTNGVVIAENSLGDSDKILTILTPNLGKISCVAKRSQKTQKHTNGGFTITMLWRICIT